MNDAPAPAVVRLREIVPLGLIGLAVRALSWSTTPVMMNDGPDFLWQADQLLAGQAGAALAHPYHPLYGALIAALAWISNLATDSAAIIVSILAGVLTVVAITCATARLVRGSGARRVTLATGLVAAVHPRAVNYSAEISSDGVFLACVTLAVATLLAGIERRSASRQVAAGLLAGLAYLARPEGLFVGAVVALWMATTAMREREVGRVVSVGARVALGTVIGVAPYVGAIHEISGEWALSMKPSVGAVGLTNITEETGEVPATSPHGWAEVVPAAAASPAPSDQTPRTRVIVAYPAQRDDPIAKTAEVTLGTLRPEGVILFVIGALAMAARRDRRALLAAIVTLMLAWCALTTVHVASHGYISNRHQMIAWALATPCMGAGLVALARRDRPLAWRVPAWALLALLLVSMTHYATWPRRYDEVYVAHAAEWSRSVTEPDAAVAIPRRRWGHATGRRGLIVSFPVHESDMLKKMRREGVTHYVGKLEDVDPAWLSPQRFEIVAVFGPDETHPAHRSTPRPWWWRWGLREPDADDTAVVLRWNGN